MVDEKQAEVEGRGEGGAFEELFVEEDAQVGVFLGVGGEKVGDD